MRPSTSHVAFMSWLKWEVKPVRTPKLWCQFLSLPLPPCGLSLCALGQALDQWVPCLPEGQEVQEGPSPQGHLSFQVALGVLVETEEKY